MYFDIVIPVGPNDKDVINKQIEHTKKNIIGFRNIYLISYDASLMIEHCITIPENIFPFSLETVSNIHGKRERNGWYLQQLLKLYAGFIIPNILDKYLVIDADTFFLKPTSFYENKNGKCLYNYGREYHFPYFIHMYKLDAELIKIDRFKSGICHHMLFETKYVKELFEIVEKKHKNDFFYNIFLKNVTEYDSSGASEYEIYFNFILSKHPNEMEIRPLNWTNINHLNLNLLNEFDYVSYHYYGRESPLPYGIPPPW